MRRDWQIIWFLMAAAIVLGMIIFLGASWLPPMQPKQHIFVSSATMACTESGCTCTGEGVVDCGAPPVVDFSIPKGIYCEVSDALSVGGLHGPAPIPSLGNKTMVCREDGLLNTSDSGIPAEVWTSGAKGTPRYSNGASERTGGSDTTFTSHATGSKILTIPDASCVEGPPRYWTCQIGPDAPYVAALGDTP